MSDTDICLPQANLKSPLKIQHE